MWYFEVNKSTVAKSINIRKTLNIHIFNSRYSIDYVLGRNIFRICFNEQVINVFRIFSSGMQEQVKEARKLYPDVILKKIKRMRIYFI